MLSAWYICFHIKEDYIICFLNGMLWTSVYKHQKVNARCHAQSTPRQEIELLLSRIPSKVQIGYKEIMTTNDGNALIGCIGD